MPSSSDQPTTQPATQPTSQQTSQPEEDLEPPHDGFPRMSRLNLAFLALSIVSLCAALYLSPAGDDVRESVNDTVSKAVPALTQSLPGDDPSATPTAVPTGKATPRVTASSGLGTELKRTGSATSGRTAGSATRATPVSFRATSPLPGSRSTSPLPGPAPAVPRPSAAGNGGGAGAGTASGRRTKCWQFSWQQDAQAVYVANLSDPYGLDGDPGPGDADGLACSDLPVDPSRAASKPAGAYVAPKPSAASKQALVHPAQDYFGFSENGVPGDTALLQRLAAGAGKAPSTVGWFSTFDDSYRADLVEKSWSNGALPVVTWQPVDSGSGTSYSLGSIAAGTHDKYLRRWAGDVVRENLPVAVRFGHEMNGNWYGWSAGRSDWNNSPDKYVAAWRHIWEVFDEVGATDDVIWLWSPSRVDDLHPSATNGLTDPAADYPGDAYVDWVGASVYLRRTTTGPTYAASFDKTVDALEQVTDKPIFFAETAAVQTYAGQDQTATKAAWTSSILDHFAHDDRIVGFLWFNNVAATVVNGVEVSNDWRYNSSAAAADAFREGVSGDAYAAGVQPD